MKKYLLIIACVLFSAYSFAQNFSNKGKDFWLGYGYHVNMAGNPSGGGTQDMVLYFTSDKNATVTVEMPSTGYTQTYTVIANQVTSSNPIPKTGTQDARIYDIGYYNRGIHVYSDVDIVAYAHIYNSSVSGASLLFPTNTLGKDYYVISYNQSSNATNANSFAFVVAVEDNTSVEITPSVTNKNGLTAGTPITVNLNKGQIYSLMGTTTGNLGTDLTGTRIRSLSTSGGCKKIAVFCGAGKMSIGTTQAGSADNLFAQALPASAWGLKYLTAPTGSQPNNYYRICVTDPTTVVKVNGSIIPSSFLQRGFFYELKNTTPLSTPGNGTSVANTSSGVYTLIEADKPINVAQYCTTQGQDGNSNSTPGGDPEMIYLSPVEQTINSITLYSASKFAILQSYINVIIRKGGTKTFTLDGVSKTSSFITHPQDAAYAYAILPVSSGSHSLYSDTGFNAIAYGFGSAESYGYNAGTNIKDLYTPVFQNPYARLSFAATCVGTPFQFSVPLSFQPTSVKWVFGNNPNISPNATIGPLTPAYDSLAIIGGKNLYYYSPANGGASKAFTYASPGTDTIKLFVTNPSPDGCGTADAQYDIPVTINPLPTANFAVSAARCISDSIPFTDASTGLGASTVINGLWDWNDGPTDSLKNPLHKFLLPKAYNIRYRPITDFGCIGDTTIAFDISAAPTAKFGFNDTTCIGSTITFSDSSSITAGTIVKWYWDYGNGVKDTLTASSNRTQVYTSAGTVTVSLVVENGQGCKSNPYTKTINIRPFPVPDFSLPIACLPVGAAAFKDTSTIGDNTQADFKYKWSFGDGGVDSVKNPIHNYATVGPFNVKLTVTSKYGCIKDTTKQYITIYQQPKAKATISSEVCLRDSTSFTDASDGKGSTVTKWKWTFGDGAIDSVPQTKHLYTSSKTYNTSLFVTTDKGCISDTVSVATIVNPLPTAGFKYATATGAICEQRPIAFTDTSKANVGSLTRFNWNMGDGRLIDTTNGSAFNETYAVYKSYTVKLMVENSKGCKSDTVQKTLIVNPLPQVGFVTPEVCLSDAAAPFSDTSKIADGSEAQFLYSWSFTATNASPTVSPSNYPVAKTSTTIKNPQVQYKQASNYFVTDTVTSNKGCAVTKTQPFTVNGANPVASFTVLKATTLCANDSVRIKENSFVDFGSITKVEIYWDNVNSPTVKYTDDNPYPGKIYSYKYPDFQVTTAATKTYNIRYIAYSGGICGDDSMQTVIVNATPKVRFTTLPGICNDTTARQITQATETSGLIGLNNGTFIYTGTGVNATGLYTPGSVAAGTYAIQYKYTNNIGCADSATQSQTVWPSPVAKWSNSTVTCAGNNIVFTDSSVANYKKIKTWAWTYGDGNTATKTDSLPYNYSYAAGNTYNATLRITTDSGCHAALTRAIKVNYLPVIDFTLPSVCLPDGNGTFTSTSTIGDNSSALFSYLWDFGDANNTSSSTSSPATHRFSALAPIGGYKVKLVITSKDQCKDSLTKSFTTVYPQPKAGYTSTKAEVCMKNSLSFINTSDTVSSPAVTWVWDLAQGNTSSVKDASRNFNDSGLYNISIHFINARGCISDTAKGTVEVHPYPYLNLGPDLLVLEGGSIPLKPLFYYGNNLKYLWTTLTPPTYLDSDTVLVPISTPAAFLDDIQYKLTLTAKGGCSVSDSLILKILHAPDIPNAFSPNNDGKNDKWIVKNLESYPGCTIEIYNRYGQLIFSKIGFDASNAWDGTFNGQPVPIGTYYYIIDPKNGRLKVTGNVTVIR